MTSSKNTNYHSPLIKITDEIYQLKVRYPFAMRELNSYLILGEKGFTVIDTGSIAEESIALWKSVMDTGAKVEKLVFTHAHPDHIGLARWFQENYQIPTFISELGYKEIQYARDTRSDWLISMLKRHGGPEIPKEMMNSEASAFEFEPDELFKIGEKIKLGNDWYETIWTPGHSQDHLCFYNQEKQVMVLGDLVLDRVSPIIGVWSNEEVNPLKDYFDSVEKIRNLPTKYALPGHGEIIDNLDEKVAEMESRHQHRLEQVVDSINEGKKTSFQITKDIYGKLGFNKFFAPLMSTISRVLYLESVGKLSSEIKNGQIYYRGKTH